jgi:hypothetical protein
MKTQDQIIHDVIGITEGAKRLTPVDKGECKLVMTAWATEVVNNLTVPKTGIKVDYFVSVLKRALDGNDDVKVEFENENDQMDYILDVCNNFKKELQKDH